jgi:Uma2 family endonuclease
LKAGEAAMKRKSKKKPTAGHDRSGRMNEPAWEIALLFPTQGNWSEDDYLGLHTKHFVELVDGHLEVLAMPTMTHQLALLYVCKVLRAFAHPKRALVVPGPLPVRLWPGTFREPDVVLMLNEHRNRVHEEYWEGADLAMEVVSADPESRRRDLKKKRAEYARAGIREYWIVDPKLKQITILALRGKKYELVGDYKKGNAASQLLVGFSVDVASVFTRP